MLSSCLILISFSSVSDNTHSFVTAMVEDLISPYLSDNVMRF